MYIATVFIWLTALVFLSPALWIAWWLIADLGEKASDRSIYNTEAPARYRPAA